MDTTEHSQRVVAMYLFENPVMQRELLVNLRMKRAFMLMLIYQLVLAAVVFFAWPRQTRLEANADQARGLVNMFFLGQYILASLMAPSFAAATITGEKERKTYEMLLASPLKPAAICLGKLLSSLAHLALLIVASLPIVMLCLPLGGVSIYEVLAAYLGLILSVLLYGMISVACSSYFQRTSASLVASYLLILPLALLAVLIWKSFEGQGGLRLLLTTTLLPLITLVICGFLFHNTSERLLHPPDVGSEGKEVVDLEQEAEQAVGLVIRRDQFPDMLFAPPKRQTLMEDGANPVYDKEIHSEIFSQGTLMLRLVIQISMGLAIPIMAATLFIYPYLVAWYVGYVIIFNMLVGPVFSAGSVTSERERRDTRSVADDDDYAVADPMGEADCRSTYLQRANFVSGLAVVSGGRHGVLLLAQLLCRLGVFGSHPFNLSDHVADRAVLFGVVSQNGDQFDDHLCHHYLFVLRAAGDHGFCQDVHDRA